MGAEESSKAKPRRKTKVRILRWVLAVAVVLIALVVFFVPAFVSSEKGRKIILAKINDSIDGEIDFGNLSMSWRGGIKVTDFSFDDGVGQTFVEVKQIVTKPHYGSILLGSLSLGETIIFEPKVEINLKGQQAKKGKGARQEPSADKRPQPVILPIRRIELVVNDGDLQVTGRQAETVEVVGIKSALTINFSGGYRTGQMGKLLANLNTKGKLGFERTHYLGLNFGPTEVEIQMQNGLLRIAPFSTTVNNGQLKFAGEADFKSEPVLLKTVGPIQIAKNIQINNETTDKLLMYLNPVFANAVNVSGVANFSCERLAIPLAGAGKNDIEVIGTVSVNKLRLQASDLLGQILSLVGTGFRGQDITIHPTRFVLRNGLLRYDDMQMDIGNYPVVFGGVIGLDKSLNMTVTLPYTTRGRTVRVGEKKIGERISLPLKGSIDRPELDVGKLLEEQLKEQLKQRLLEGLDRLLK